MDLTFESMMEFLEQAQANGQATRMRAPRISMACMAQCLPEGHNVHAGLTDCTVVSLSWRDLEMKVAQKMDVGDEICVRLPADKGRPRWVRCKIRQVRGAGPPYTVDANFCDVVRTEAGLVPMMMDPNVIPEHHSPGARRLYQRLTHVEAELEKSNPNGGGFGGPERRVAKRFRLAVRCHALLMSAGADRPLDIMIRDISRTGAGIHSRHKLAVGERLAFTLNFGQGGEKDLLMRVVRCETLPNEGYDIGAVLVETTPHNHAHPGYPRKWRTLAAPSN